MTTSNAVVYIVDDDQAVRDSLRMLIEAVGFAIQSYESGEAFLRELRPEVPGCIVLDMRMEGMSGFDLQETLIEKSIDLPIIFITGYGDVPTAVRATRQGAIDFIEKPFKQEVLLERIQEAIDHDMENRKFVTAGGDIGKNCQFVASRT